MTALAMLDELGARPQATRVNPAGLTTRQVDVLRVFGKLGAASRHDT